MSQQRSCTNTTQYRRQISEPSATRQTRDKMFSGLLSMIHIHTHRTACGTHIRRTYDRQFRTTTSPKFDCVTDLNYTLKTTFTVFADVSPHSTECGPMPAIIRFCYLIGNGNRVVGAALLHIICVCDICVIVFAC